MAHIRYVYQHSHRGNIWGYNTPQAEVLYFALEDNYRRINDRVLALKTEDIADYSKFRVSLSAQGINTGLLEQISNHMERYPNTSLIVIDTFVNCQPPKKRGQRGTTPLWVWAKPTVFKYLNS